MSRYDFDLAIIGAGAGGLTVAAVAAQLGVKVALIEKGEMGGECLNSGCVPSKSLLAAAHAASSVRGAEKFGIIVSEPEIDWRQVHGHLQAVIRAIAPNDSQSRFESMGVTVIRAAASFIDAHTLQAGVDQVSAKYIVIATGSSPAIPAIEGLDQIDYLTNENLFSNREKMDHLIIVGAGPVAVEMAQAHCRLGARVSLLIRSNILARDDAELAAVVSERLQKEGVHFVDVSGGFRLQRDERGAIVVYDNNGEVLSDNGSHLLLATGRRANVEHLALERAGITCSERGITVDERLRTSQKYIFAIGDVIDGHRFTHMAAYQAGIVIRNMLFRLPAKVDRRAVPWVTFSDPELAQVGLTEAEAVQRGMKHKIVRWHFAENDRAQAEKRTEGMIKAVVSPRGRILGVGIVGLHAGELIQPWILAITQKLKLSTMASMIVPYPTLGEVNKRIAGAFYSRTLFSGRLRWLVRLLLRL